MVTDNSTSKTARLGMRLMIERDIRRAFDESKLQVDTAQKRDN